MKKHYYQTVIVPDEYGDKLVVYEARKDTKTGTIETDVLPFELTGNSVEDIINTLKLIERDIKMVEPIKQEDTDIFLDEDFEDEEISFEDLTPEELDVIRNMGFSREDD